MISNDIINLLIKIKSICNFKIAGSLGLNIAGVVNREIKDVDILINSEDLYLYNGA